MSAPAITTRSVPDAALWTAFVLGTAVVLLVPAWAGVDHGCRVSPPPLSGAPDPGTPRADYCDALDGALRWVGLVVLPTVLVAGVTVAFARRRPLVPGAVALLVITAAFGNWAFFDGLDWARTA